MGWSKLLNSRTAWPIEIWKIGHQCHSTFKQVSWKWTSHNTMYRAANISILQSGRFSSPIRKNFYITYNLMDKKISKIRKVVKFVYPDWFIFPENLEVFCRIRKSWQPWMWSMQVFFRVKAVFKGVEWKTDEKLKTIWLFGGGGVKLFLIFFFGGGGKHTFCFSIHEWLIWGYQLQMILNIPV